MSDVRYGDTRLVLSSVGHGLHAAIPHILVTPLRLVTIDGCGLVLERIDMSRVLINLSNMQQADGPPTLLADGGVENFNAGVDACPELAEEIAASSLNLKSSQ